MQDSNEPGSNPPESESRGLPLWILLGGTGFIALLGLLFILSMIPPTGGPERIKDPTSNEGENKSETGIANLANQPDQENCKAFLGSNASKIVKFQDNLPAIPPAVLSLLNDTQKKEAQQKGPTKLDAQYLEEAFFFREIASRLVSTEDLWSSLVQDKNQKKITRFFSWVCRMVSFEEPSPQKLQLPPANPTLILKKGWGNGLDRSLVFLTLFEQAGNTQDSLPPILISLSTNTGPGNSGAGINGRFLIGVWSPEKKDYWLLDPELGLPLDLGSPNWGWLGPIVKSPEKTGVFQLNQQTWNLESAAFAQARYYLVRTVSALSPRLQATETFLQQNGIPLFLGRDSNKEITETEKALESIGVSKPSSGSRIELWKPGLGLLMDFTNPEKGGTDTKETRTVAVQRTSVPWNALPPATRVDLQVGGAQMAALNGPWLINFTQWDAGLKEFVPFPVSERIGGIFGGPFVTSSFEQGKTKDQMLRGKWQKLTSQLVGEEDDLKKGARAYESSKALVEKDLQTWVSNADKLYAAESRAKRAGNTQEQASFSKMIEDSWKQSGAPVYAILNYALARSRGVEIGFLLALIRQEEAERLVRGKVPEDRFLSGWAEASSAWKRFNEDFGSGLCLSTARSCWAESVYWSGEPKRAIAILEQAPRAATPFQKKVLGLKAEVLKRLDSSKK